MWFPILIIYSKAQLYLFIYKLSFFATDLASCFQSNSIFLCYVYMYQSIQERLNQVLSYI